MSVKVTISRDDGTIVRLDGDVKDVVEIMRVKGLITLSDPPTLLGVREIHALPAPVEPAPQDPSSRPSSSISPDPPVVESPLAELSESSTPSGESQGPRVTQPTSYPRGPAPPCPQCKTSDGTKGAGTKKLSRGWTYAWKCRNSHYYRSPQTYPYAMSSINHSSSDAIQAETIEPESQKIEEETPQEQQAAHWSPKEADPARWKEASSRYPMPTYMTVRQYVLENPPASIESIRDRFWPGWSGFVVVDRFDEMARQTCFARLARYVSLALKEMTGKRDPSSKEIEHAEEPVGSEDAGPGEEEEGTEEEKPEVETPSSWRSILGPQSCPTCMNPDLVESSRRNVNGAVVIKLRCRGCKNSVVKSRSLNGQGPISNGIPERTVHVEPALPPVPKEPVVERIAMPTHAIPSVGDLQRLIDSINDGHTHSDESVWKRLFPEETATQADIQALGQRLRKARQAISGRDGGQWRIVQNPGGKGMAWRWGK